MEIIVNVKEDDGKSTHYISESYISNLKTLSPSEAYLKLHKDKKKYRSLISSSFWKHPQFNIELDLNRACRNNTLQMRTERRRGRIAFIFDF